MRRRSDLLGLLSIDLRDVADKRVVQIFESAASRDTGVVNNGIEPPVRKVEARNKSINRLSIGDVQPVDAHMTAHTCRQQLSIKLATRLSVGHRRNYAPISFCEFD